MYVFRRVDSFSLVILLCIPFEDMPWTQKDEMEQQFVQFDVIIRHQSYSVTQTR